jgi:hypothetical protein
MTGGRVRHGWLPVAAALLIAAPPAVAQEASAVSLGLSWSVTAPTSPSADADVGPGVLLRLRGSQGIGPSVAFNWFSTPVRTTVDGKPAYLGRVRLRPLMAGIGYSRQLGRKLKWSATADAGIAFARARATGGLEQAYAERLGVGQVTVAAHDAFAWRVNGSLWMDLGPRYGLVVSLGYLGVRPEIAVVTSAGTTRGRVDVGSVVTSVGFAYGIF